MKPPSSDPPLAFPAAEVRADHERALLAALRRNADALLELQARADRAGNVH